MNLPRHSFCFLKKNKNIEVVDPSKYLKKNNQSLKNAVKNDLFDIAPDINFIDEILKVCKDDK